MTTKQKAAAYDKAIERTRQMIEDYKNRGLDNYYACAKESLEKIFPELAESEDERIKYEIIGFVVQSIHRGGGTPISEEQENKWIAWLEKGEQKPIDKIQLGKKYKCIASPRYSTFMIGKIYKPEDKFLCSLMNFCSDCFEPIEDGQKPDLNNTNGTNTFPKCMVSAEAKKVMYNKPAAWSEEDIMMKGEIINVLQKTGNYEKEINWLKSLRPQPQWKPSDEHIDVLDEVIRNPHLSTVEYNGLIALKEQLKAL